MADGSAWDESAMRLVLLSIPAAVLIGYVGGGRLGHLSSVRVRWPLAAFIGIVLQFAPVSGTAGFVLLVLSFVALLAFAATNLRLPGFPVILVGLALNFTVIAVDHGMPVTRHALIASGQRSTLRDLIDQGGSKHHLATSADSILPLGDVIAIGAPVRQAISIGDIGAHIGGAWFVIGAMRPRTLSPETDPGDLEVATRTEV